MTLLFNTWIENGHLGDWRPEKDRCQWLSHTNSLDSEDSLRTGCWNVSHQQQSFSGLQSPRWSFSIKVCYSWVQTILLLTSFKKIAFRYILMENELAAWLPELQKPSMEKYKY